MNVVVILAGGTGTRLGEDIPKQYIKVKDKPIIAYCLDKFVNNPVIDAIQIVANPMWHTFILEVLETNGLAESDKWKGFSEPGQTRQLSIYNALKDAVRYALPDDYIMFHDAARPLVSYEFIKACFEGVKGHDGILPVLPMKDTVYLSENGKSVSGLLDRKRVFAGQAPEVFKLGTYYEANRVLLPDEILKINGSTEPAVLAGMDIALIDGDEQNYKITTKEDLLRFKRDWNR